MGTNGAHLNENFTVKAEASHRHQPPDIKYAFIIALTNKFEQLPDSAQLIILIVLILITATEVFGRSYIFNKPRVLNGWGFIRRLSNKKKRQLFKLGELKASEQQYKTENKFVFPELVDRRIISDIV
ncbi:hypothetical protein [Mucilaginibacter sp. 22184]|uniref:hypothetical protein n=1 Tax=Mucilaginibacter sp. 22184 TaxID=3453887 RepID=UPI003F8327E9